MYNEDTIAAISTAQGTGGIGIIRISGDRAFEIGEKLFSGKRAFESIKPFTINYGKLIDPENNETVDEILLSKMAKPNTFTKEDVIEINCHGGIVVLKRILELIIKQGARLAEPGEFTKRAFLNGRIDLSQAEAVIDLITSKTAESSRTAVKHLEGKLSKKIKEARSQLIELIAHIEVTLDYPEYDVEEITVKEVYKSGLEVIEQLNSIIKGYENGRILREGITTVIAGRPNVGKSSLMNALSGKEKAIVTNIPGTTRDVIEEYININGIPVRIIDTAGIRNTEDPIEKIGVERALKEMQGADLIIAVIDVSEETTDEDFEILQGVGGKKVIYVINKIDLAGSEKIVPVIKKINAFHSLEKLETNIIQTSLSDGLGIKELENKISEIFLSGNINGDNDILVTNVRHKVLIEKAIERANAACTACASQISLDCIAIDIKSSAEYLGEITGETVSEDVMHEIFSRFCIGK